MPKALPDTVWIRERPEDYLVDDEFLVSTYRISSGNPESFVRRARADRLAGALKQAQEALARADRMLPDDIVFAHNAWAEAASALEAYGKTDNE